MFISDSIIQEKDSKCFPQHFFSKALSSCLVFWQLLSRQPIKSFKIFLQAPRLAQISVLYQSLSNRTGALIGSNKRFLSESKQSYRRPDWLK